MRPILFQWRGLKIWSYTAMLYVGMVTGIVAGNVAAHAAGIDAFRTYLATLLLIVAALVGARLLYVASNWEFYRHERGRVWNRNAAGASMYGGIIVAVPLSVPLLGALRLPIGAFWDVAIFTILVGMIFTRVGCLLNGCCAGRPTKTWIGVRLPNHLGISERRVPTQCLEGLLAGALLVTAINLWPRRPFDGALFLLVAAGYALGRLPLESMRETEPGRSKFTVEHAISAVIAASSLTTLAVLWPS